MHIDADKFLGTVGNRSADKRYNVVFIDLPDPSTIELNKLYTRGFYSKVRRLLARGGVMVVQSTSPFFARESYWCISRTIAAAGFDIYNYHINVESFGDWGFVLATRDLGKGAVETKIAAMDFGGVETRFLTPEVFRSARTFGKDVKRIKNHDINTLMHPVLHRYYLKEDWQYD
jgi:spermidine synthase